MTLIKNKAKAFLIFFIILFIELLIYTSIIYFFCKNQNLESIRLISFFLYIFSFFILGLISAIIEKNKGIISGFTSGIIIFLFVFLYHLIIKDLTTEFFIKNVCAILSSIIGGIIGANIRKK